MAVGVGIPVRSWPESRSLTYVEMAEFAQAADRLGYDSAWAIDHFPMAGVNQALQAIAGPDPLVFLSHVAARTRRIQLGTMVACAPFRLPGQLAREARALAELSGGRFILAVGSGSRKLELEANGLPTTNLVSRFEEYLAILAGLLAGETVDHQGTHLAANRLQVLGNASPILWVAASGPRSMALAARYASGWAGAREDFSAQLSMLRSAEADAGRPAGSVVASRRAQVLLMSRAAWTNLAKTGPELSERVVVGGPKDLIALATEYRESGCQHMILHFAGTRWSVYDGLRQLEMVAPYLPRLRGR